MSFIVTARKWRPMVFEDVVGQQHITTTLRNAIATERISHAYIFSGARGCGKTSSARILAKAINCLHPKDQNPDNECELCREITENRSVNVFEIDGASNRGVEEIRNLREAVRYGPAKGKYKVYIIDEVHMLTKEAFNALLKTLEEPPSYVIFIFATTEIHKVPLTILSRCQRFDFRRIALDDITKRLSFIARAEKISIDEDALLLIAKRADGSMRDAQSMFDQVVSYCGTTISSGQIAEMWNIIDEEIYFKTTDLILSHDVKGGVLLVHDIINAGIDVREFLQGLIEHYRNILIARITGNTALIETSESYKKRYQEHAVSLSEHDLLRLIKLSSDLAMSIRWSQQPRLNLELGIMQMIKMDSSVQIGELLNDIQELKKKVGGSSAKETQPASLPINEQQKVKLPATPVTHRPTNGIDEHRQSLVTTFEPPANYSTVPKPLATVTPQASSAIPPEPTISKLSSEEVRGKWPSFINEARKQRIDLWSMLNETTLIDIQAERLQIGCPDDFHMDALKRNRQFLTELAERVYGAKVVLDTILAKDSPRSLQQESSNDSPKNPDSDTALRKHPVVQSLMKEFGAVVVEK
jgi:DNA polymerase-3 subunit gamma/tau